MKEFLLSQIFIVSKKPVLFRDLLESIWLYDDKILADTSKLNFRFNYVKLYFVYAILCLFILAIFFGFTHNFLEKTNIHISIILSVFVTSIVFVGFDFFKLYMRDLITQKLIKSAWEIHFPYFTYEKYSQKIVEIFEKSQKDEISKRDLEKYVMDKLSKI